MNQKTCNPEGLKAYPEAVRDLPYCNWRYEEVKEQLRKVPYNSITGAKASSSRIETMTTLEKALAVVDRYDGVIVKVSGKVGFIDIDKCVREDGSLDERAQKILELLPGAMVEYSPSGRGLHVIIFVPEGYVFDRDEYYVNNKEIHVENYFPGYNNQLMTMTGNLYRGGSMEVTIEQLMLFEETFMKRPEQPLVPSVPVPEGGSILTDEEAFLKASHSSTVQKFVDYYNGEWEKYGGDNPNWFHSEADLGFCSMLAFYCRGDMEQMDRIFRESGLMRDKWDERRVDSTYGRNTMRKAIAECKAFYEKGYHADAEEDFSDLPEDEAEEETLTRQQAIDALLAEKDCSVDRALSPEYISHAAWAYLNDTARYVKLKGYIPKAVGARTFDREVQRQVKEEFANNTRKPVERLVLKGITVKGIRSFGQAIANAEEEAFLVGDGNGKPKGLLHPTLGGQIGITTAGNSVTADEVLDLIYKLKRPYRTSAAFIMADSTLAVIRKLKDGTGQYFWQPALTAGEPDRLLGFPVYTSQFVPAVAAGQPVMAFGDFSYYNIGDRGTRSFAALHELYAGVGQVAFVAKERVDGKLILPEAVQVLKMKGTAANG